MIEKITYIESNQFSPYRNLAVEEYLLLHCEDKECILYLWQNQNTVVIGRNQNAWKECRTTKLEEEGGHLARRLSGGGAVYHDLGNINFTFLISKEEYDLDRQLQVIIGAMEILGLKAEKSGRNDILIDGKKFSGNAFYEQEKHCYHHGTIMVGVNMETLSRYLTVSKDKLKSKGVDSVKQNDAANSDTRTRPCPAHTALYNPRSPYSALDRPWPYDKGTARYAPSPYDKRPPLSWPPAPRPTTAKGLRRSAPPFSGSNNEKATWPRPPPKQEGSG